MALRASDSAREKRCPRFITSRAPRRSITPSPPLSITPSSRHSLVSIAPSLCIPLLLCIPLSLHHTLSIHHPLFSALNHIHTHTHKQTPPHAQNACSVNDRQPQPHDSNAPPKSDQSSATPCNGQERDPRLLGPWSNRGREQGFCLLG